MNQEIKQTNKRNLFDLLNTRFGKLVVKERKENCKNGSARWLCVCDCGKKRIAQGRFLRNGTTTCCNDCNYEDFTGQNIGKLLVIKRINDKIEKNETKVIQWECVCECGEKVIRKSRHLRRGSCRCEKCKAIEEHQKYGYEDIRAHHWYNIKKNAKKRNIEFNITMEYTWTIFKKQNEICALSGITLVFAKTKKQHAIGGTTASLDRIDSSKGYIEGNVQWVHKWVNVMKNDFTTNEFLYYCKKITTFNEGVK